QRTASDPCLWVEGVELFSQSTMLVPFEMVHANYTRPIQPMHGMYPASTNGLASGNTHLEAICHALFEVIERDALAIWDVRTDADQATRRIELTTVRDDQLTGLVGQFASAGLECGLWDITTDNGLPTVLCIVAPSGSEPGHMGLGSGCHTSRTIAARRALMEAAQTRLNYISGSRDDLHAEEYGSRKLTSRVRAARAQLESSTPVLDFSSIPSRFHQAMRPELDHTLEAIRRTGLKQAIWVDLMQEALGVPVARLIVPGLEAPHDDPQYVPGERAMRVASDG
ncbi:MAG: YcaO-like family protein, partial [Pseudomonadota bacterium]